MKLIKEQVSYHDKNGDLYCSDPEEICRDSKLDDIIIRCDNCCEMIAYSESLFIYRCNCKEKYAFCNQCAKYLFNV